MTKTPPTTARLPRVHVLLLNWNGWRDTLECLESLFRLDYPDLQVIVCDNASTDGSVERIRGWARGEVDAPLPAGELRWLAPAPVKKPIGWAELDRSAAERGGTPASRSAPLVVIDTGANLGFAGGNNVGLRYLMAAREPRDGFLWLLNNDMVVAPDSLRRMMDVAMSDDTIGCVGGTLLEYKHPNVVQSAGGGRVFPWQGMPRETSATGQPRGTPAAIPRRLDFVNGGCLVMRVATADRVGCIDEQYYLYCEDVDYSLRIRALGLRIAHVVEAEVWHKGGGTVAYFSPRHDYYLVRNSLLLVRKFYPAMLPAAFVYSFYRCALPKIVRRQWDRLAAVRQAYRDFMRRSADDSPRTGMDAAMPVEPS